MSAPTGFPEDDRDRTDMARAVRRVPKPASDLTTLEKVRFIVKECQANRIGGVYLDMFTAQIIVQVHDALNEVNRAKFASLPMRKMAFVALKLANQHGNFT
jgi:hypothetical protein